MSLIISVENIKCGGCVNSITTALSKLDAVEKVTIDKELETITIDGNPKRETVLAKLNDLGYPEKGTNSLAKKAKSYVNCAIGKFNQ